MILALAASMLVFSAWMFIGPLIMPQPPAKPATTQATTRPSAEGSATTAATSRPASQEARTASAGGVTMGAPTVTSGPAPAPATAEAEPVGGVRLTADQEFPKTIRLGNDDPEPNEPDKSKKYWILLRLNSRGASIDSVNLTPLKARYLNYPRGDRRADLDKEEDPFDSYTLLHSLKADDNGDVFRSMTTQSVTVLLDDEGGAASQATTREEGKDVSDRWRVVDLADKHWSVVRRSEPGREIAECAITVKADGKPMLRVVKTYTLALGTYDVEMDLRVESLDGKPHQVKLTQQGPINIHQQNARQGDSRKVYYALKVGEAIQTGNVQRKETVSEKKDAEGKKQMELNPVPLPGPGVEGKLLWAASGNQYFAAIVAPVDAEGKDDSSEIEATQVIHLTHNTGHDENADLTFQFVSKAESVKPDTPANLRFDVFLGPKERTLFQNPKEYPKYSARNYMGTIQEEYYWCVWAPLAELMSRLLIGLHDYVWPHNWGIAIIILVLVVRVILHPVTKKGQVSMTTMQTRMSELAPKLEELKKKYGSDRNKLNQETMALYRKEGINPASNMMSCLPMLLQMPIWVALWATLSNTIELRHASFMIIPGRWILDLSSPDAIYRFAQPIRFLFFEIEEINILPFLWGLSMVLQQKLMPRPKSGKTSEQMQQQQRMMYMMAVVFTVMFYSFPSGLTLYIMASNFFGLVEQWRIRQHIEAEQNKPAAATVASVGKPKGKGLAASVLAKFDRFDQEQRGIKRGKKK
ncbi:MAG: YidC/Oxa1 family insertase periplasmic-domain containing protein [Phycisphaerae bacterium]|nr:YidC/Oxa1 family insertase periplasmic-domain containing protein [Phycisphaerae bacterium]